MAWFFSFHNNYKQTMSSNGGEGGGSLISKKVVEKLKYFYENGKSEGYVDFGDLYLQWCEITDEMLEEIILKWFIKKKLFDKLKELK